MRYFSKIKSVVLISILTQTLLYSSESIDSRLDKLENMIEDLKKENNSLKSRLDESENSTNDSFDLIYEVEDRIDSVETLALIDKLNFSLGFQTKVESFDGELGNKREYEQNNIYSSKVKININSDITENLKFDGRLSMYKYWANSISTNFKTIDSMQGRRPSDSSIFVERAYIDWRVFDSLPLYLTIGRQPSSDGPSHQFKDNTVRKATYSALAFDGAADGVVATLNLTNFTGVANSAIRFAYGKGFQDSNEYGFVGDAYNSLNDTNFFGVFVDTSIPSIENSLIQIYGVSAQDIIANNQESNDMLNQNIGDFDIYGAVIEFTNLLNSGVDIFLQGAISKANPNGKVYLSDMNQDGTPESYGLLTSIEGDIDSKDGNAIWTGFRYTIPMWVEPKIGFEFNRGSKNWFSFTQGSNDLTNKLATRGEAIEIYYIHPINRYANLRVGATKIDYDYSGSGWQIGTPMKVANNQFTGNSLDSLTNYYLLFNLLY